ncbi:MULTISPECIES: phosphatase PAP2 family protein [unclassified Curtobacterium]|uniref:phosphatase PAP2 family protein n=1 Tax=unclassified Curtobacterium TaxID=257496 RepID=UPI0015E8BA48|nr:MULTISPECIES: phosphatase PAP2 family protein [unclassified Curtobacterium]
MPTPTTTAPIKRSPVTFTPDRTGEVSRRGRWFLLAAVGFVVVPLVYAAAVLTPIGQRLEDAALSGVRDTDLFGSDTALNVISVPVILLLVVVIVAVGLGRRRLGVGIGAGVVVLASAGTSTLLKRIAARPEIAGSTTPNSFPSGHATIALAASFAVLMVTPRRFRPVVLLVGAAYAVIVANQTVVYGWHRMSDIVGACGVALFWLGIVRAVGPRVDLGLRGDRDAPRGPRVLVTGALLAALGIAVLIGAVAAVVFVVSDAADGPSLLVAGRMAASGSVVLTMLAVWLADGMHHAGGGGRR